MIDCNCLLRDVARYFYKVSRIIIPLSAPESAASPEESAEENTIGLLAEARLTSYVKGRWVYTDNGGDHQYSIVHPAIPGNGDYSAYPMWCEYGLLYGEVRG